jgi:hypothetical protein
MIGKEFHKKCRDAENVKTIGEERVWCCGH